MKYPLFTKGLGETEASDPSPRAEELETLSTAALDDPSNYVFSRDLSQAINVSLILGMPLLITGEPGTGKTELGRAVAHELGAGLPYVFETKSTSQARDLFYNFDSLGRYGAKDTGADPDPVNFITYSALGLAILNAFELENVSSFFPNGTALHNGPKRSLVIIDEIDKAPRDFTNDLLNEIARMAFRVPELGGLASPGMDDRAEGVPAHLKPIVIITSNSERGLPDPFLRRCIYFHIPFPSAETLKEIVATRLEGLPSASPLVGDAIDLFSKIRDEQSQPLVQKRPGTAELLNWLQFLVSRGYSSSSHIRNESEIEPLLGSIYALVKTEEDLAALQTHIPVWCQGG
ncbi:MAG: MoxR family ATPase [Pseudomonadota bacterium]